MGVIPAILADDLRAIESATATARRAFAVDVSSHKPTCLCTACGKRHSAANFLGAAADAAQQMTAFHAELDEAQAAEDAAEVCGAA